MNILELSDVYKIYGEGTVAINNVSLAIEEGEFVAIMGPSGSGKSTLLRICGISETVSAGKMCFQGMDLYDVSTEKLEYMRKSNIGFIFQDFKLIEDMSVEDNIALSLFLIKEKRLDAFIKTKKILNQLGIEAISHRFIGGLSGGEKQRVAIARALVHEPKLILLDEPTGKLDFNTTNLIMDIMNKIHKEKKKTIVMVTHDAYVASFADRVLFLRDGEIYNEVTKGNSREEFFYDILDLVSFLMGGVNELQTNSY